MISLVASRFSFWFCLAGAFITGFLLLRTSTSQGIPEPIAKPSEKPVSAELAGSGIVESFGETTRVSAFSPGVVTKVHLEEGGFIKKGAPLFELDSRVAESNLAAAKSGLEVANAEMVSLQTTMNRLNSVRDSRAVSQMQLETTRNSLVVAEARKKSAEAKIAQAETVLSLLKVASPADGTALQVNIRPGEFTAPGAFPPPVLLGNDRELQVRVDIDEELVSELPKNPSAIGYVRGLSGEGIKMEYVRSEPMIVPKRNLSNLPSERVDTRVLQVIFKPVNREVSNKIYIGQQLDVFISK